MNDKTKERISAFIDNEAYDDDIIDQLKDDGEMRATMARYSLVGDVLNSRYSAGSYALASKVRDSLEAEATLITPGYWLKIPKSPKLMKQAAGLAMAATVAAVAILLVGNFSPTPDTGVSVAVGPITDKPIRMTAAVHQKLNSYLISHTEYSASGQMKGMLPYTRIASFVPGQRIAATIPGVALEK